MPGTRTKKFDPARYLSASSLTHKTIHVQANHVFYTQGDTADAIYYLETGRAKLIVVSKNGKEATVSLMVAHDFIGEELLAGNIGLHTAAAKALTACTALKLNFCMTNFRNNERNLRSLSPRSLYRQRR